MQNCIDIAGVIARYCIVQPGFFSILNCQVLKFQATRMLINFARIFSCSCCNECSAVYPNMPAVAKILGLISYLNRKVDFHAELTKHYNNFISP